MSPKYKLVPIEPTEKMVEARADSGLASPAYANLPEYIKEGFREAVTREWAAQLEASDES
jgi:hypothetical protein